MSETIMERLKNETKADHQQLEKSTIPFIKKANDDESYAYLLRLFYGFFQPVENKIQSLIGADLIHDIKDRRQSATLLNDLKTINAPTEGLATTNELPVLESIPQALGAMYVLEGSTLGGRFISQMLAKQLNRTAENGIGFFSGYGEETMAKWGIFTGMVNQYAAMHPQSANEIVAAANETFSKFGKWVGLFTESEVIVNN